MLVTLGGQVLDHGKSSAAQSDRSISSSSRPFSSMMVECRAPPVFRGVALVGRAILEPVALVGLGVVPAKSAALEHRVQRVDEDEGARQLQAMGAAALAEAAKQIVFGQTCQALVDQPVHQAQAGREFHAAIMPRNRDGRKTAAPLRFRRYDDFAVFLHEGCRRDGRAVRAPAPTAGTAARPSASPRSAG